MKAHKSRHYHSLVRRLIPTVIFLPALMLALVEFNGADLPTAFRNAFEIFHEKDSLPFTWSLLLLSTLLFLLHLRPLLCIWDHYKQKKDITMDMRNRAMVSLNTLKRKVLLICMLGFLSGGVVSIVMTEGMGPLNPLMFFYFLLGDASTAYLTAILIYMNLEILLFPVKRILMMVTPEEPQKFFSFNRKLVSSVIALILFLFFQVFSSSSDFLMFGFKMQMEGGISPDFHENLLSLGRHDQRLKDLLAVFEVRIFFFFLLCMRILVMLKKSLKNPLETVESRLAGLTSDEDRDVHKIAIVNNDEFATIYSKINTLIQRQQGELEQSRERLHKIVDNAADPIVSFNEKGEIFIFNPAAEKYFQWTREDVAGHSIRCLFSPDGNDLSACTDADEAYVKELISQYGGLKRYQRKNNEGEMQTFEANINSLDTPSGKVYTAILRDISGQIDFEENLQNAKESAEQANRLKTEFLANMSHELRTPLNAILGFTQLLDNDKTLKDAQRDKIRIVSRSGEHLLGLINDILDISKIEAGKLELHDSVFRLKPFIEDIREMFELKCRKKGLVLDVEYLNELPPLVEGDLGKLRQILINLLGNAVKFTEEGGISMVLGMEGEKLRFSISDTGKGIPEEEQKSILEPFTQSSNVDNEGGTGLGLAISSRFVEMMGGHMDIQSREGEGSTFSFAIRLQETNKVPEEAEVQGEVLGLEGDLHPKVLIVDDKVNNRLVLKEMLEGVGFTTMEAEDGVEAVERNREFAPELIFMDIKMPRKDGYEAVEEIRKEFPELPVFALTASAFKHDEARIRESGFDGYLAKPFKQSSLFKLIEENTPIAFRYYQPETPNQTDNLQELDWDALTPFLPGREVWDALDEMVTINDFLGVKNRAVELEQKEELIPLARRLAKLADGFDEEPLMELLNQWKEHSGEVS